MSPAPSTTPATNPSVLVLFAGGGTGGHLYPNLAIAELLTERLGSRFQCRYLCSTRPIDASILTSEGAEFTRVPARSPSIRPLALWRFCRAWGPSVRAGRRAIREARRLGWPVVMVTSGGFVAAPLVQSARVEKCPVLMLNLDAVPGRANRWIARHADRILTAAPVTTTPARASAPKGWVPIPPIVRRGALPSGPPDECRRSFGLDPERPTLLVTGGSQGASSINRFLIEFVRSRAAALRGWQVIHQAGEADGDPDGELGRAYRSAGVRAHVAGFVAQMGQAWGASDLCVCRAGAGNVGESWATRTPCLFMPYPFHKDAHQRANAMPLVERGAGILAHDAVDASANMHEAGTALEELLTTEAMRARLRAGLASLGPADGAQRAADAVLELA